MWNKAHEVLGKLQIASAMALISLEHLLKKEKAKLVLQLIEASGQQVSIEDFQGKQLLDTSAQVGASYLIESSGQTYGQVSGQPIVAKPVADLIHFLLHQAIEKQQLDSEIWYLQQKINLMHNSADIENALLLEKGIKEVQQQEASIWQIHEATTRFVPNQFIRALGFEHITEVSLGDNVEKEVTVLFNDIRGYTTLAETMTPTENFKFVNAFHGRMGPFIQQHEGFINQYLGDGIMALFTKQPDQALSAAVDMQIALHQYNVQRIKKNRQPISMGIGLHTGPLIMGIIGDQHRLDAATIADSVNTSSRIESLTKHFGVSILLSEESLKKLEHPEQFHTRYLGQVLVKGKNEPIGVYECFDGVELSVFELKQKALAAFEEGLALYYQRAFHDAAEAFNRALKTNPDDVPSRLFLYKSVDLIAEGVAEDWTGVEVMVFK